MHTKIVGFYEVKTRLPALDAEGSINALLNFRKIANLRLKDLSIRNMRAEGRRF